MEATTVLALISYPFVRRKDVIITGEFNVYSAEVEQALLAPAVQDSAVIGLPDGANA